MVSREYITYNDTLYWVHRKIRDKAYPEDFVAEIRKYYGCDNVLRTKNQDDTMLVFVKEVTEATIVD